MVGEVGGEAGVGGCCLFAHFAGGGNGVRGGVLRVWKGREDRELYCRVLNDWEMGRLNKARIHYGIMVHAGYMWFQWVGKSPLSETMRWI